MKVLHIDCSVREDKSISRQLSGLFVSRLRERFADAKVDYLDLAVSTPLMPTEFFIRSNYTMPAERTLDMKQALLESDALIDRMHEAETFVIGMPMHNWSIPSNFKLFLDNVVRIGRTFVLSDSASEGLLKEKRVFVINTRGVDFSFPGLDAMDHLVPYLRTVLGFMGLTNVVFIDVHPVKFASPEVLRAAFVKADQDIASAVAGL